jgi:hypothetical protein
VQVWAPRMAEQSRYHGHLALVVGEKVLRAGESEYIQVLCDGLRVMPLGWLREIQ